MWTARVGMATPSSGHGTLVSVGHFWMFRVLRAFAFVLSLLGTCVLAWGELPRELRVVTYNIHHGEGLDDTVDLPRIALVLIGLKPDIVALQAVDEKTGRSGGVDQAAELGRFLGMKSLFSRAIDHDGGGYGNAVLTKLPVRSQETVKLKLFMDSQPELAEQRAVQVVELGEKDGPGLLFLCTSLDYRGASAEKMASTKTINELIKKRGDVPAILAGTVNAGPGGPVMREFAKVWKIAGVDVGGARSEAEGEGDDKRLRLLRSYPADKPVHWVNNVMCRPMREWQVVDVRVVDERVASNHRPILAVLRRVEKKDEVGSKK
jgi:endonuclease/exonuclease/phosphatase family metal-dependent hydrolase